MLFSAQAQAYRTFHMRDPQVFYNKEDIWDVARNVSGQTGQPEPVQPTYIVATLPGEKQPEFLLVLPFAPRGKDNLIGWMAARCDGDHLGELIFYQLSKQQLMYGPMQIDSRIDQDQDISKDLSLWNQQGSHVLRGNMVALPVNGDFLYVESIYLQATEARMPQLKKVVLAMGDRLIYRDTFPEALADLRNRPLPPNVQAATAAASASTAGAPTAATNEATLADRVAKLREQAEQLAHELDQMQRTAEEVASQESRRLALVSEEPREQSRGTGSTATSERFSVTCSGLLMPTSAVVIPGADRANCTLPARRPFSAGTRLAPRQEIAR